MALDDLLRDRQAGSGAATKVVAPVQALKDSKDRFVMLGRDPNTVISDVKHERLFIG
jgi:hypothetical protein